MSALLPGLCRGEAELSGSWVKFLVLGLALLFLGKQETVEPTLEVSKSCMVKTLPFRHVVIRVTRLASNASRATAVRRAQRLCW
jgi:hypothetical protein